MEKAGKDGLKQANKRKIKQINNPYHTIKISNCGFQVLFHFTYHTTDCKLNFLLIAASLKPRPCKANLDLV